MVGDLKFHAQMLGQNNMSTSWCMRCQLVPHEWKIQQLEGDAAARQHEGLWTIDTLKAHKLRMMQGYIKVSEPKEVCGVVDYPIWDFIDIPNTIYPVLHGENGLANVLVENFYDFLDEKVEVLSQEEIMQQNSTIIADIAFGKVEQRLKGWHEVEGSNLQIHRQLK